MAQTFIQKWDGKCLVDAGAYVSKEYRRFQNALIKEISKIAESIGAKMTAKTEGHYDTSCFVERDGKFVYISHSSTLERCEGCFVKIKLDGILIREAKSSRDYAGGHNSYTDFKDIRKSMLHLLSH